MIKSVTISTKNNKPHNIDKHEISILEWFLKDFVTLKTGVMAADNSALLLQKYIIF